MALKVLFGSAYSMGLLRAEWQVPLLCAEALILAWMWSGSLVRAIGGAPTKERLIQSVDVTKILNLAQDISCFISSI